MKRWLLSLALLLASLSTISALDASVSYAKFKSPQQNYVEVYLHVVGSTVNFVTIDTNQYQAAVEVMILFKQFGQIIKFDKYRLKSPTSEFPMDFIDQRRFGLENGTYTIEVSVSDVNLDDNTKTFDQVFTIDFGEEKLQQSDIQLLSSFRPDSTVNQYTKNGYYLESLPFNFYNKNHSQLIFYNEIYNTDKELEEEFVIRYALDRVESNGDTKTVMLGHKKRQPGPINVILLQKNISELKSGNYNLVVEVRNRENKLLSSKTLFFQRSNPFLEEKETLNADLTHEFVNELDEKELRYSLRAISMNVRESEAEILNIVLAEGKMESMRRFLFSFWVRQNPNSPEMVYKQYMEVARAIDKLYSSGFGFGFETDRGYTFMKYGKPNDIVTVDNDPSAPPYEIWVYYEFPVTQQNNVKFLFYNPSLDGGNYVTLHSTARGEINNPQWEIELYRDAPNEGASNNFIDNGRMMDGFNRHARRLFNDM